MGNLVSRDCTYGRRSLQSDWITETLREHATARNVSDAVLHLLMF